MNKKVICIIIGIVAILAVFGVLLLNKNSINNNTFKVQALIDCDSPILYLYSDNTYKLFQYDNKTLISSGKFDYDLSKVFTLSNTNMDDYGYNILDKNNKNYSIKNSEEFKLLLNNINVNLDRC